MKSSLLPPIIDGVQLTSILKQSSPWRLPSHFMTKMKHSRALISHLCESGAISQHHDTFLEHGAGAGGLTRSLLQFRDSSRVLAVESDVRLHTSLRAAAVAANGRLSHLHDDSTVVDELASLTNAFPDLPDTFVDWCEPPQTHRVCVVCDLPFDASNAYLARALSLAEHQAGIYRLGRVPIIALLRADAAARLTARPGHDVVSTAAWLYQNVFDVQQTVRVPSSHYTPPTRVDSVAVVLSPRVTPQAKVPSHVVAAFGARALYGGVRVPLLHIHRSLGLPSGLWRAVLESLRDLHVPLTTPVGALPVQSAVRLAAVWHAVVRRFYAKALIDGADGRALHSGSVGTCSGGVDLDKGVNTSLAAASAYAFHQDGLALAPIGSDSAPGDSAMVRDCVNEQAWREHTVVEAAEVLRSATPAVWRAAGSVAAAASSVGFSPTSQGLLGPPQRPMFLAQRYLRLPSDPHPPSYSDDPDRVAAAAALFKSRPHPVVEPLRRAAAASLPSSRMRGSGHSARSGDIRNAEPSQHNAFSGTWEVASAVATLREGREGESLSSVSSLRGRHPLTPSETENTANTSGRDSKTIDPAVEVMTVDPEIPPCGSSLSSSQGASSTSPPSMTPALPATTDPSSALWPLTPQILRYLNALSPLSPSARAGAALSAALEADTQCGWEASEAADEVGRIGPLAARLPPADDTVQTSDATADVAVIDALSKASPTAALHGGPEAQLVPTRDVCGGEAVPRRFGSSEELMKAWSRALVAAGLRLARSAADNSYAYAVRWLDKVRRDGTGFLREHERAFLPNWLRYYSPRQLAAFEASVIARAAAMGRKSMKDEARREVAAEKSLIAQKEGAVDAAAREKEAAEGAVEGLADGVPSYRVRPPNATVLGEEGLEDEELEALDARVEFARQGGVARRAPHSGDVAKAFTRGLKRWQRDDWGDEGPGVGGLAEPIASIKPRGKSSRRRGVDDVLETGRGPLQEERMQQRAVALSRLLKGPLPTAITVARDQRRERERAQRAGGRGVDGGYAGGNRGAAVQMHLGKPRRHRSPLTDAKLGVGGGRRTTHGVASR